MESSQLTSCEGSVIVSSSSHGKSEVRSLFSSYPLRIMQQEMWNSYVTLSLLGFGGGMISGDNVRLNITVEEFATLW